MINTTWLCCDQEAKRQIKNTPPLILHYKVVLETKSSHKINDDMLAIYEQYYYICFTC